MRAKHSHPDSGFTLLELVVVVMFLGILAGVAAPKYRTAMSHAYVHARAVELAADLKRARSEAMSESINHTITFSSINSTYTSNELENLDRPGQSLIVNLASDAYDVAISSVDFGGDPSITFDWYGAPSSPGSVILNLRTQAYEVSVDVAGNVSLVQL